MLLLMLYWFIPGETFEFGMASSNSNFSLNVYGSEEMQFYSNMRFANPRLSYNIDGCTLQKETDMKGAFDIMSDLTLLEFYSTSNNEDISITCDSHAKMEENVYCW